MADSGPDSNCICSECESEPLPLGSNGVMTVNLAILQQSVLDGTTAMLCTGTVSGPCRFNTNRLTN